jgi:hypothetical protein
MAYFFIKYWQYMKNIAYLRIRFSTTLPPDVHVCLSFSMKKSLEVPSRDG